MIATEECDISLYGGVAFCILYKTILNQQRKLHFAKDYMRKLIDTLLIL